MTTKYQPSNGTEGEGFISKWCESCHLYYDEDEELYCQIISDTMFFNVEDDGYPEEWIIGEDGPQCTAYTNDGVARRCSLTKDMFEVNEQD